VGLRGIGIPFDAFNNPRLTVDVYQNLTVGMAGITHRRHHAKVGRDDSFIRRTAGGPDCILTHYVCSVEDITEDIKAKVMIVSLPDQGFGEPNLLFIHFAAPSHNR
jgi:hypothetical protein